MITFDIPKNPKLLASIGAVAVRHGQLDYILRMTIKSISAIGLEEAIDATEGKTSDELRRLIRKMAKPKLGEASPSYLRLEALLNRSQQATRRRNELFHGLWAADIEGEELFRHGSRKWKSAPEVGELEELTNEMQSITNELNEARLSGFLRDALVLHKERAGTSSHQSVGPE